MAQTEVQNEPNTDDLITKEEMNIVEYPVTLVSKRAPKGLKALEYHDWITVDGERRPLHWIVMANDAFGLPAGIDQDILIAIMEVWREAGYKDKSIPIGSIYHMLKKMALPLDGRMYRRFKLSLDRFTSLYIKSENAFWDKENGRYLSTRGFHLFESYHLIEKFSRSDRTLPLPFGYIQASDFFYKSVLNGNLKDLNLSLYLKLPNPLSRRLYRYLDKKRYWGAEFSMNVKRLTGKLGLTTADTAKPAKLRALLTPALDSLVGEGFLLRYAFLKGKEGVKLAVAFKHPGSGRAVANSDDARQDDEERASYYAHSVAAELSDMENLKFYVHIARLCPVTVIYRALSETRDAANRQLITGSRARFFTDLLKRLAQEQGIDLKLRSKA